MHRTDAPAAPLWRDPRRRGFVLRRLHALAGVVPVGVFTVVHLAATASALFGREAFDAWMRLGASPVAIVLEVCVVLLPLVFHACYGVVLATRGRYNVHAYPFNGNWAYTAQRITGLVAFVFVAVHVYETWGAKVTGAVASEQHYDALVASLSSTERGFPLRAALYLLGIGACVFHLVNGTIGFLRSTSLGEAAPRRRKLTAVIVAIGVALVLSSVATVVHLATGSLAFGAAR